MYVDAVCVVVTECVCCIFRISLLSSIRPVHRIFSSTRYLVVYTTMTDARDFRCVPPDYPGHLGSYCPDPNTLRFPDMIDWS